MDIICIPPSVHAAWDPVLASQRMPNTVDKMHLPDRFLTLRIHTVLSFQMLVPLGLNLTAPYSFTQPSIHPPSSSPPHPPPCPPIRRLLPSYQPVHTSTYFHDILQYFPTVVRLAIITSSSTLVQSPIHPSLVPVTTTYDHASRSILGLVPYNRSRSVSR